MNAKRIHHRRKSTRVVPRKKLIRPAKHLASKRKSNSQLDFIDAAARLLDLPIEPAWKPAVAAHLAAALRLADSFLEFPLTDDAEPAPIFTA